VRCPLPISGMRKICGIGCGQYMFDLGGHCIGHDMAWTVKRRPELLMHKFTHDSSRTCGVRVSPWLLAAFWVEAFGSSCSRRKRRSVSPVDQPSSNLTVFLSVTRTHYSKRILALCFTDLTWWDLERAIIDAFQLDLQVSGAPAQVRDQR
jgi:hypothetical protein